MSRSRPPWSGTGSRRTRTGARDGVFALIAGVEANGGCLRLLGTARHHSWTGAPKKCGTGRVIPFPCSPVTQSLENSDNNKQGAVASAEPVFCVVACNFAEIGSAGRSLPDPRRQRPQPYHPSPDAAGCSQASSLQSCPLTTFSLSRTLVVASHAPSDSRDLAPLA